jgi:phosphatidylinositol alpha-1,6-mannosyltransferase
MNEARLVGGPVPRTLFVTNDFPPRVGGAQTYYWNMLQTLDPDDVVVVAPAHPDAAAFDARHPYTVIRDRRPLLLPTPALARRCARLIGEHELALLQLGHPLPAGLLGPWVRRTAHVPYVVFLGGAEVTVPGAVPGLAGMLRAVLVEAALLLTVSRYTADQAARLTRGRARVEVLRPALEVDRYDAALDVAPAAARAAQPHPPRLVPRKGQDMLIDAVAALGGQFPDARLALVGGGGLAGELRDRAAAAGIGDRVLLPGEVTSERLRLWLRAADVFAGPSRTRLGGLEVEGFGIVYAEAALSALPVIVGRSGGAPEAVIDGESGLVVDAHGSGELRTALARLLGMSAEERRRMGESGRRLALSRHAPEVAAARYHELLRRAVRWPGPVPLDRVRQLARV